MTLRYHLATLIKIMMNARNVSGHGYKSGMEQRLDNLRFYVREGRDFTYYHEMGMDRKGKSMDEFMGRKAIARVKQQAERQLHAQAENNLDYNALTKDKFVTYSILSSAAMPCVPVTSIISQGMVYAYPCLEPDMLGSLWERSGVIYIKNPALEFNAGVYRVETDQADHSSMCEVNGQSWAPAQLHSTFGKGFWIIQPEVKPHQAIRAINDTSLNTLRIVTINTGQSIRLLPGYLSLATGKSHSDRWGDGGIYIGVNYEQSRLHQTGYGLDRKGKVITYAKHPDSGILFEGYSLPYITQAIEICLKAHKLFPYHYLIGWDLAICEDGPYILEANETPGMNAIQLIHGGLRSRLQFGDINA